jgi:hypothetical protein
MNMELFVIGIFFALLWIGWELHSVAFVVMRLMRRLENETVRRNDDIDRAA